MGKFAATLLMTVLPGAPAAAQQFVCEISSKFSCSAEAECTSNKLGVWNILDFEAEKFQRCDRNGCDSYLMEPTASGLFINLVIPGRAMFAKMSADGSKYIEVVSLATDVLVSFGTCRGQ